MRAKFGTRNPAINEDFWHRMKVIKRKRQIELQKLDNELPDTQIPIPNYRGTHPKVSIWSFFKRNLLQLLP